MPLFGLALAREYFGFKAQQQAVYDNLLTTARGTAVSVERELQLQVSALEALATSPALESGDLDAWDAQARAFLAHQAPESVLGLSGSDLRRLRIYGLPEGAIMSAEPRAVIAPGRSVFETKAPTVTNLYFGHNLSNFGFSVDVPVFHNGMVVYDLFLRVRRKAIQKLLERQKIPPNTIVAVIDHAGRVVARVPGADKWIGSFVVPDVLTDLRDKREGFLSVSTLDGMPAVSVFTHVNPFGWAVVVGAPKKVIFAPLMLGLMHVVIGAAAVLTLGLLLALLAARSITQPIEQLRRLATRHDADIEAEYTGLPEADTVAAALVASAAERRAAAGALAETETRFRTLFERSPTGTMLVDPVTTKVVDCNEVAAAIVGCSIDEFLGRSIQEFTPRTPKSRTQELLAEIAAGGSVKYETRISGRSGPRDVVIAGAPVQVAGRTLALLNQIDVTEHRQAEAGLRDNEERLELAREGANLGIWDWDLGAGTVTWSESNWRLHGLTPRREALNADTWAQTVDPAHLADVRQELVRVLATPGRQFSSEYTVNFPDGTRHRLLGCGQVIRDESGQAIRLVGINMDVTARYEAEKARDDLIAMLETERGRLAEIVESMPVGVGIINANGKIVLGNRMLERLTGAYIYSFSRTPIGDWIARNPDGSRMQPEDYPVRRALVRGETVLPGVEFLYREPTGQERWVRVGSLPLLRAGGREREALAIIQDIDAEKRLLELQQKINAELEQRVREEVAAREAAQQRAAHAERMHALGQIAGGIAHDFNNVLQAVSGGAALIERRPDDPERVLRHVRMVLDAAKRGAAITSRLLSFSRRGDLRAEAVDAAALLTDMAEVLTHTLGGSVVCQVDAAPSLPSLFADRGQLETVLVNLATNARDAMPNGGTLTFRADVEVVSPSVPHPAELAPGGYVRIAVVDTGTGMDAATLGRVTEPFFTTKAPGKGTGLGLAMAKGFAEQSGGGLSVESTPGEGTQVVLWLPATEGEQVPLREERLASASCGRIRVLLVDDDSIVRNILAASLEDAGYAVWAAESGEAALARLSMGESIDVLVTDLTMPGMDGLTLIRSAREQRGNLITVLLTGYAGDGAALAVGEAIQGMFSLLRKPATGVQLADRIHALLATRKQTSMV